MSAVSASPAGELSARPVAARRWALWNAPRRVIALVLLVELSTTTSAVLALLAGTVTGRDALRFALLAALSLGYAEASRQVERSRRLFVVSGSHVNVTSVWTFAAALILPAGLACVLALVVYGHLWLRTADRRRDGQRPYRAAFSAAIVLASCLTAAAIVHATPTLLRATLAAGSYAAVTAVLLAAAIHFSTGATAPARLFGSRTDNLLESATLAVGGVTAAAVVDAPWLAALVLPAAFLLQHHALMSQLVAAATTDGKTQLLNQAAWHGLASRELDRPGAVAALLMIDMDHFKAVNDTHGHLAGDAALRAVGTALADELRGYDIVGRFGGEEFVALLPGVVARDVLAVADRVRRRVESLRVPVRPVPAAPCVRLTASVGVALCPDHAPDVTGLLRHADAALYAAKNAGRNRARLAELVEESVTLTGMPRELGARH